MAVEGYALVERLKSKEQRHPNVTPRAHRFISDFSRHQSHMNHQGLLLTFVVLALAGCVTPFRAPADVAHIKLERADSPVVTVEKIWLERKGGLLAVKGSVLKRLSATDTTKTHLDVTLYSSSGQVLRCTVEYFEPRQIRHQWRRPSYGEYRVVLDPLPAETARIEVAAHEGEHSAAP